MQLSKAAVLQLVILCSSFLILGFQMSVTEKVLLAERRTVVLSLLVFRFQK